MDSTQKYAGTHKKQPLIEVLLILELYRDQTGDYGTYRIGEQTQLKEACISKQLDLCMQSFQISFIMITLIL